MKEKNIKKVSILEYSALFIILLSYSEYLFVFYNGIEIFEYLKYSIGLFFLYKLIKNWRYFLLVIKNNKLLIIFITYIGLSFLWTSDYSNLPRIFALFVNFSVAIFILNKFTLQNFLSFLRVFFLFILISNYIAVILFPSIGIDSGVHSGSWNGVFAQKNRTGIVLVYSLITTIVLMVSEKKTRKIDIVMFLMTLVFVINTKSSTAILISFLIITISTFYLLFSKYDKKIRIMFLAFSSSLLVSMYFFVDMLVNYISDFTGKDLTLTGRTFIWSYLLEENKGISIFLGNGYGYYWSDFNTNLYEFYSAIGFVTTTAHNGFIDIFLDLGYIGLFLFFSVFIFALIKYMRGFLLLGIKINTLWPILVLICMIPYNFSESLFISYNSLSIIFIFCSIMYSSQISEHKELI